MRYKYVRVQGWCVITSDGTDLLRTSFCSALSSSLSQSGFFGEKPNKNPVLSSNLCATMKSMLQWETVEERMLQRCGPVVLSASSREGYCSDRVMTHDSQEPFELFDRRFITRPTFWVLEICFKSFPDWRTGRRHFRLLPLCVCRIVKVLVKGLSRTLQVVSLTLSSIVCC